MPQRAGRPPKPTEAKRKIGNPGKRALPDKAELVAVPPMEASVAEITVEQALERSLIAGSHWLAESDAMSVTLLRECLETYAELKADPKSKPSDVLAALKLAMSGAADCGFNPSERARLGLAEVKAASRMERLRAQVAQRSPVLDTGS